MFVVSDSRSKVASDPSSPSPYLSRPQVSAGPLSERFHEDARTGYEDESNHGEPSTSRRNQLNQYHSHETPMTSGDVEMTDESNAPVIGSMAMLEDDLSLSDSDDEKDKSGEKKDEPMDEDDDAFFF